MDVAGVLAKMIFTKMKIHGLKWNISDSDLTYCQSVLVLSNNISQWLHMSWQ